ncbi:MAG: ABC transporter ATP-binding protein [Eubacteriales bacterium]|nr:ABC transporter ATP-binding protein [Eubacteriales bacterium]
MKYLMKNMKQYKVESILAPLFKMLEAFFDLFVPLVVADIINKGIVNQDKSYIISRCLILVLLALIGISCSITAQYFSAKAAVGCAAGLRHSLFNHIQTLGFSEIDSIGTSTMITRMTSDINQVQNGVNMFLRLTLRSPFIVFGAMVMAFIINAKMAMIFVVAIPVLSLIIFGIMKITSPLYKKVQGRLDRLVGITRENLTGVRVVRAFGKEAQETERFQNANEDLIQDQLFVGRISGLMNPLTYVVVNLAVIAIIQLGSHQVNQGLLLSGDIVALVNYMSQILIELVKLANTIVLLSKTNASLSRIEAILDTKTKMKFVEESLNQENDETKSGSELVGNLKSRDEMMTESAVVSEEEKSNKSQEAVCFDHVSLLYNGAGEDSLSDISFTAYKGQTIGIIGGTGSGKSSLVNLIPRFYDATGGKVSILGQNIDTYSKKELRNRVAVVAQKAQLFSGTIRSNLLWGNEDATDEELWEALRIAQAADFVKEKPQKLDEPVEQAGRNFSGGQKQRLTIARALVGNPDILILDDSASALDLATDAALRQALAKMNEDEKTAATLFIVSQRTVSIQNADQILVLDDGELVGIGRHEELLSSCEVYREIYESQFKKGEK